MYHHNEKTSIKIKNRSKKQKSQQGHKTTQVPNLNEGIYMEHAPINWQNEFFAGSQRILIKVAHILGCITGLERL